MYEIQFGNAALMLLIMIDSLFYLHHNVLITLRFIISAT